MSNIVTISGNTVTISYLNGSTQTMSVSDYLAQTSFGGLLYALTEVTQISTYYLVNGSSSIQITVIQNASALASVLPFFEASYTPYKYNGGIYYLNQGPGFEEAITLYNNNLYIVDAYNFAPSVQEITTFLNQAVA